MTISRYDASGNTFVIFHTNEKKDYSQLAIQLCEQENTDGMIVVVPHLVYDFEWLFYNNDGSSASMCGNGTRAVAHYAYTNQLCERYLKFLTGAGEISCEVNGDIVKTTMPKPKFIKENFIEDETLACGTGMTASFLVANKLNLIENNTHIYPKSGEQLTLSKDSQNLYFQGKVTKEYTKSL